jgi:hypothetical protein
MSLPIVRVSIVRCEPAQFDMFEKMMIEADSVLRPGLEAMRGCRGFFAGADRASASLTNMSLWETLEDARQMDTFQPMLDLAKRFLELGARLERPIMNYTTLWRLDR